LALSFIASVGYVAVNVPMSKSMTVGGRKRVAPRACTAEYRLSCPAEVCCAHMTTSRPPLAAPMRGHAESNGSELSTRCAGDQRPPEKRAA